LAELGRSDNISFQMDKISTLKTQPPPPTIKESSRASPRKPRPPVPLLAPIWANFFGPADAESPKGAASPKKCLEFDQLIAKLQNEFLGELYLATPWGVVQRWPDLLRVETSRVRSSSQILLTEVEYGHKKLDQYEEYILCTLHTNPRSPRKFTARCSVAVEEGGHFWTGFERLAAQASPLVQEVFRGFNARVETSSRDLTIGGEVNLKAIMATGPVPQQVEIFIDYGGSCEKERLFDMFTRQCAYYDALALETAKKGAGVAMLENFVKVRPHRQYVRQADGAAPVRSSSALR